MADFGGRWIGRIEGTNSGNILVELTQQNRSLSGRVRLNDSRLGVSVFEACGEAGEDQIALNLTPIEAMPGIVVPSAKMRAKMQSDGSIRGEWETDGGTAGIVIAVREQQIQQGLNTFDPQAAAATAFVFDKNARVPPCVVDYDTLRQLYREMSLGAAEALRMALADPNNTVDEKVLRLAHAVTIQAWADNGDQIITLDGNVLRQESLPRPLRVIRFELGLYYRIVLKGESPNRAFVTLDFAKPRPFDLSNPSGSPTPNNSAISVIGNGSIWVSGIYQKLLSTLEQGKTGVRWLHSAYVYDLLLLMLGLPFGLTFAAVVSYRVATILSLRPAVYSVALFVFMITAALTTFRLAFSFARWLLPNVEFAPRRQPLERRIRTIFAVLILGVLGSLGAWLVLRVLSVA